MSAPRWAEDLEPHHAVLLEKLARLLGQQRIAGKTIEIRSIKNHGVRSWRIAVVQHELPDVPYP